MRRTKKFADGGDLLETGKTPDAREQARQAAKAARVPQTHVRPDRISGDARRAAADAERFANRSLRDPDYAGQQAWKAQDRAWWNTNYPGMSASQRIATGAKSPFGGSYGNPARDWFKANYPTNQAAYQARQAGVTAPASVLPTPAQAVIPKPMKRGGKVRAKRFDDGGLASSGSQSAFDQQRSAYPSASGGLGNLAPLVQVNSGDGSTTAPGTGGPLNYAPAQAQPAQSQPAMKRGGKVKMKANCYAKGGAVKKGRGDGCITKGRTKGRMV